MTRLTLTKKSAVIHLNKGLYPLDRITEALTEFSDHFTTQFSMQFSQQPQSYYIIRLQDKHNKDLSLEKIYAFCNTLLS